MLEDIREYMTKMEVGYYVDIPYFAIDLYDNICDVADIDVRELSGYLDKLKAVLPSEAIENAVIGNAYDDCDDKYRILYSFDCLQELYGMDLTVY